MCTLTEVHQSQLSQASYLGDSNILEMYYFPVGSVGRRERETVAYGKGVWEPGSGQNFLLPRHCHRTTASGLCNTFSKHFLKQRQEWTRESQSVSPETRQTRHFWARRAGTVPLGSPNMLQGLLLMATLLLSSVPGQCLIPFRVQLDMPGDACFSASLNSFFFVTNFTNQLGWF